MIPILVEPQPGDPDRSEDILNDVVNVMKKHGTALIVENGGLFLCARSAAGPRAIAAVSIITPDGFTFKPIDWTKARPK